MKAQLNYNPNNLPEYTLATVKAVKKTFSEAFYDPTSYRIVWVDGTSVPWTHDRYSRFEPGVVVLGWKLAEFTEYGDIEHDRGMLVANLAAGQHYTVSDLDLSSAGVEIWNNDTGQIVSKFCTLNTCQDVKANMTVINRLLPEKVNTPMINAN